ncbi:MAG: hypothetical protein LVT47_15565 [Cyanobacteria bacterium LVE1205-1]|jgi:hypothetical protein
MTAKNLINESQSLGIMGGKRFSVTFSRRTEDQTLPVGSGSGDNEG